jgi:uncharacterized protein (TIGR02271 family)
MKAVPALEKSGLDLFHTIDEYRREIPIRGGEGVRMRESEDVLVIGKDGLRGSIDRASLTPDSYQVRVVLDDGREALVPRDLLERQGDGTCYLPLGVGDLTLSEVERGRERSEAIPVVAEHLEVGKRQVETGRVRISKQLREREEVVDEPLLKEEVEVRRVRVDRQVDGPLPVREEGGALIIPVVEEVLVVEKRYVLREELHVTKRRFEVRDPQAVVLRSEQVTVERVDPAGRTGGGEIK